MTDRKKHAIIGKESNDSPKQNIRSHLTARGAYGFCQIFHRLLFMVLLCVRMFRTPFLFMWRCKVISAKELQINDEIRVKEVRVVGPDGEQKGIMDLNDAKEAAYSAGYDLVLIAPTANPPVCRIMDYGKFRFENEKREKEARKKQQIVKVKEVQLSCRIDTHDFNTRVNQARKFLTDGDKVKAIIRFKGREMAHMEIGQEVLKRFMDACADVGGSDKGMITEGRLMSIVLSPIKHT